MTLRDRIRAAAAPYLDRPISESATGGWRYPSGTSGVQVAWPWPAGVRGPRVAPSGAIDCSTLTTSILMRIYPDAGWTQDDYARMQVFDGAIPDSPIYAVVSRGVGERLSRRDDPSGRLSEFRPEAWHLVQGWRVLPGGPGKPSGHAFLVYDRGNGVLDVLESSSASLVGPRWRTTTAAELRQRYPAALFVAALREPS